MSAYDRFEILLIGITLGAFARPLAGVLFDRHADAERRREQRWDSHLERRAETRRALDRPQHPHPSRTTADWLNEGNDQP